MDIRTAIVSLCLVGFCSRNRVCSLRGSDWIFTYNSDSCWILRKSWINPLFPSLRGTIQREICSKYSILLKSFAVYSHQSLLISVFAVYSHQSLLISVFAVYSHQSLLISVFAVYSHQLLLISLCCLQPPDIAN
jgi:hypothetical protein